MTDPDGPFHYDEITLERAEVAGSVVLVDEELHYADLFGEVIWDGTLTPDKRARLDRAAEVWKLGRERVRRIEDALLAAYEVRHRVRIREERPNDEADEELRAPFVPEADPRLAALQRRIEFLEAENEQLRGERAAAQERHANERATAETRHAHERSSLEERVRHLERAARGPAPEGPEVDVETTFSSGPHPQADEAAEGDRPSYSPAELHAVVAHAPREVDALRALFKALKRRGDFDRRWNVAAALTALGAQGDEEREMLSAHPLEGLVRPARSLDADAWSDLVRHPEEDPLVAEVFASVAPALVVASAARAPGTAPPGQLVDPTGSTVQAVRCVAWAATILGLAMPTIRVDGAWSGLYGIVPGAPPSVRIGAAALSGRSAPELAFAAGRTLATLRREVLALALGQSTRDVEDVFLAALVIGNPGLPIAPDVRLRLGAVVRSLEPMVDATDLERLRRCVLGFIEAGGRTHLKRFAVGADRTAARAGLVLCGDLAAARTMLELEDRSRPDGARSPPGTALARFDDLVAFATGEDYGSLRRRLGIAVEP